MAVAISLVACGEVAPDQLDFDDPAAVESHEQALPSGSPSPTLLHVYDATNNNTPEYLFLQQGITLATSLTTMGAFARIENNTGLPLTLESTSITVECSNGKRGGADNANLDVPANGLLIEARCPSGSQPQLAILLVTAFRSASASNAYAGAFKGSTGQGRYYHSNYPTEVRGKDGSLTTLVPTSNSLVGTFRNLNTVAVEVNYSLSGTCPGKSQADVVRSGPRRVNPYETTKIELKCSSGVPRFPLFDVAGWRGL